MLRDGGDGWGIDWWDGFMALGWGGEGKGGVEWSGVEWE